MVDVLFRMAFLMLYAAAWVLVVTSLVALRVLWAVARWCWATVPSFVARVRAERRLRRVPVQQRPALVVGTASLH